MTETSNIDTSTTVETSRNSALAFIHSGRSFARTGDYSKAIDDLQHAIDLEPSYEALYYLGLIYIERKQYKDAMNVLKKAIDNSRTTSRVDVHRSYFKYAFACEMENQFQEAIESYTKFIERVNGNDRYPGLLNRGICYDKLEQYNDALRDFNDALTLTNDQSKPYCLSCRAKVKAKINDLAGALNDYDQAVTHTAAFIEQNGMLNTLCHSTSNEPYPSEHLIPMARLLSKLDPFSPLSILLNAVKEDDADESVNAMHDYNRLLDTESEQLKEQMHDLELETQSEHDSETLKNITYNIAKVNLVMETVDKHQAAMKTFSENKNFKIFYCSIYYKLEEIFIACKSIASGKIKPMEGKLGQIADVMTLVGEMISIAPIVGEPLALSAKPIAKIAHAVDYKRQKNIMTKIANLGCTSDLWKISQSVAEKLTVLYKPLLLKLILPEQERRQEQVKQVPEAKCSDCCVGSNWWKCKCLKKTKQKILKEEIYTEQARKIGEYAVVLILESLLKEKIVHDNTKSLDQQLIDAVCILPKDQAKYIENVKSIFSKHTILTQNPEKKWTLDGFYHEPGILTVDHEHYARVGANVKLYEYRNGTKEEAIRLGFVIQV